MRRFSLSICIPTYNRACFLHACLQSIIASREGYEQQVEIVISDNASNDNTPAVVKNFQYASRNIRYYRNAETINGNQNIVKAAQLGEGEYLWVFGDDDKVDKGAVLAVMERIAHGCNLVVLNFSCHSADFSQQSRSVYYSVHLPQRISDYDWLLKTFGTSLGLISAIVMHHSIVQERMDDRLHVGIDYGFPFVPAIYRDMTQCCRVEFIPDALVLNRLSNSGDYDWNTYFVRNMALLLQELRTAGYSPASIRAAKNGVIRRYIGWRIVSQKMEGDAWCDIYTELWKYYRDCWAFWLLCLSLALLPGAVLRVMRATKRALAT